MDLPVDACATHYARRRQAVNPPRSLAQSQMAATSMSCTPRCSGRRPDGALRERCADAPVQREVVVDHPAGGEAALDARAHRAPVEPGSLRDRARGFADGVHEIAVLAVADELAEGAARTGDHRRAAGHRLDDAEPERLLEVDEMDERPRAAEQPGAAVGADRAEVADVLPVEPRLDLLLEVGAVLDDAGETERQPGAPGELDRFGRALVGVDPAEEKQVAAAAVAERERV